MTAEFILIGGAKPTDDIQRMRDFQDRYSVQFCHTNESLEETRKWMETDLLHKNLEFDKGDALLFQQGYLTPEYEDLYRLIVRMGQGKQIISYLTGLSLPYRLGIPSYDPISFPESKDIDWFWEPNLDGRYRVHVPKHNTEDQRVGYTGNWTEEDFTLTENNILSPQYWLFFTTLTDEGNLNLDRVQTLCETIWPS